DRAGLRRFDQVVAVDLDGIQGISLDEAAARIRAGPDGTTVRVTVKRPGESQPRIVRVSRQPGGVPGGEHSLLEPGIGYIWLGAFVEGAAGWMRGALDDVGRRGIRGL